MSGFDVVMQRPIKPAALAEPQHSGNRGWNMKRLSPVQLVVLLGLLLATPVPALRYSRNFRFVPNVASTIVLTEGEMAPGPVSIFCGKSRPRDVALAVVAGALFEERTPLCPQPCFQSSE